MEILQTFDFRNNQFLIYEVGPAQLVAAENAVRLARTGQGSELETPEQRLASALGDYADLLECVGRLDEAVAVRQEAVGLVRDLWSASPGRYQVDSARHLDGLSGALSHAGYAQEALTASRESIQNYRACVESEKTYDDELALALVGLSGCLARLGHNGEAVTASGESVVIFRSLVESGQARYTPGLAVALKAESSRQLECSRKPSRALAASEEAVSLYRGLVGQNPLYALALAQALTVHSGCLAILGRRDSALAVSLESTQFVLSLRNGHENAYVDVYANVLYNLSLRLFDVGDADGAREMIAQSVDAYLRLADEYPRTYVPIARKVVGKYIFQLSERPPSGKFSDGLKAFRDVVRLEKSLAKREKSLKRA